AMVWPPERRRQEGQIASVLWREAHMTDPGSPARSPQVSPRTIGVIWLLYFAVGAFSTLLARGLVVSGDAVATANNLLEHATLFQAATSTDLVGNAIYIALTALLYGLFRPVNRGLALTATFLSLAGCIVQIAAGLLRLAAPIVLADHRLSVFTLQRLQ